MPVRFTTIGRQRTLSGIAKAVYDVGSRADALEQAVEALRRANPQLGDDASITPGMNIAVPALGSIKQSEAAAVPEPEALQALAAQRARALASLAARATQTSLEEAKKWQEDSRSPETVSAIIKARPDLRDKLDALQADAVKRTERIAQSGDTLDSALKSLIDSLKQA
jgi:cysteinyl-tRNA synthetase